MNNKLENKPNSMIDVLVSFDGSSPCFAENKVKSRNLLSQEAEKSDIMVVSKQREHPKVNLPFYRNNRSKKIKVFNVKSPKRNSQKLQEDKC